MSLPLTSSRSLDVCAPLRWPPGRAWVGCACEAQVSPPRSSVPVHAGCSGGASGSHAAPVVEVSRLQPVLSSPPQLMVFNMGATVLYITAFITCSASVEQTSLKGTRPYNQRAAASVSTAPWASAVTGDWPERGLCPWAPLLPGLRPGTCHLPSSHPNSAGLRGAELSAPPQLTERPEGALGLGNTLW